MYLSRLIFLEVVLVFAIGTVARALDSRPIIGILSEPTTSPHGTSYVAASYVKWVEMGGARAAVIPYDMPEDSMIQLLSQMNGAVFPGGGVDLSPGTTFRTALEIVFNFTLSSSSSGNPFVLWGTCLGFESLALLAATSESVLQGGFDSEHLPLPLNFSGAAPDSVLFANVPKNVFSSFATEDITLNNHQSGVTPESFSNDNGLSAFYSVLSTNLDRKGRNFVSTIEAKHYPIFGTQWHPEKDVFEWNENENLPHSSSAIASIQWTAFFLGEKARCASKVEGEGKLVTAHLFYNFSPTYTGKEGSNFEQCYYW
mmetsp:Transcript_30787/g.80635  ORF Transcript_30787/g.80635 Transcript_30787/m.80635 type:complete len:313 (-) Transcript_30787:192-1130(-)